MNKVGDKVKIRVDLAVGKMYGDIRAINDMLRWRGTEQTIERISDQGNFRLKGLSFFWDGDMFEVAVSEPVTYKLIFTSDKPIDSRYVCRGKFEVLSLGNVIIGAPAVADRKPEPPVAEPEPPKPEPIMIDGKELKVGSKFILKPYDSALEHYGIKKEKWDELFAKILTVKYSHCRSSIQAQSICGNSWMLTYTAIDRIIEVTP